MVKKEHKIKEPSKQVESSLSSSSSPGAAARNKKYKGVRMRSWGSWVSEIRAPNQKTRIWLGSYSTAEAAARAYDAALVCLKGSSANLNFPMSASHYIPQDTVLSPKSIQRVAAAAANSFVDNGATGASSPPPIFTPSSSSSSSSPPPSPSDQMDDGASFMSYFDIHTTSCDGTNSLATMDSSWYSFEGLQSPKYMDQMLNGTFFDPPVISEELYEESDFSLWSFC